MQEQPLSTTKNAVLQAIHERRSLRQYQPDDVPHHLIEQVLKAGTWSPSAHNRQPWRMAVITTTDAKESLALAMGRRLRHDLEVDSVPQLIIEKDLQRSYDRLTSAPILIVLCLTLVDMDRYTDTRRNDSEFIMAVQSVAMCGQNMLLAAHTLGLAACWMCAPLFCPDVVQQTVSLPDDWQPQGIITMGYPAQARQRTREPLETRVLWR